MVNKVILIGNIAKDPEKKEFENSFVHNMTIAVNKSFKNKQGEYEQKATFINLVAWNKKVIDNYVRKGILVYIEGEIENRTYEDGNGNTRYITEVVVYKLVLLSSKKQDNTNSNNDKTMNDFNKGLEENDEFK